MSDDAQESFGWNDEALHKLLLDRIEESEMHPENFINGEVFKREFLEHMALVKRNSQAVKNEPMK